MFKIISAFFLLLAVAKGQEDQDYIEHAYRLENFISEYGRQHDNVIENFNFKLKHFQEKFPENINEINMKGDSAYEFIVETNGRIDPLEFLSGPHKYCVSSNRNSIPTIADTEAKIRKCVDNFYKNVGNLLKTAERIRDEGENYYKHVFPTNFNRCHEADHFRCINEVMKEVERFTKENQKDFDAALGTAVCIVKLSFKKAIHCASTVHSDTVTDALKAIHGIEKCIKPDDKCKACSFRCNERFILTPADPEGKTVHNLFYHSKSHPQCLLASLQKKTILLPK